MKNDPAFWFVISFICWIIIAKFLKEPKHRIAWESWTTGFSGQGQPMLLELGIAWRDHANHRYSHIKHWLE